MTLLKPSLMLFDYLRPHQSAKLIPSAYIYIYLYTIYALYIYFTHKFYLVCSTQRQLVCIACIMLCNSTISQIVIGGKQTYRWMCTSVSKRLHIPYLSWPTGRVCSAVCRKHPTPKKAHRWDDSCFTDVIFPVSGSMMAFVCLDFDCCLSIHYP